MTHILSSSKVNTTINIDEWVYLAVGWDQYKGLHLYMNGLRKAYKLTPNQEASSLKSARTSIFSTKTGISIGCSKSQSDFLVVYIMMVEVTVGLSGMQSMIEFAPPLFKNEFLLTSASAFGGSAFQRRLKATDTVRESRGTLIFDGIHAFLHDLGSFAGMYLLSQTCRYFGFNEQKEQK